MTSSMTAFGRLEESGNWGRAIWEIRTVNHRYLDMAIRLPEELRMLENAVRERISAKIKRGKVDCILRYEADDTSAGNVPVNTALAEKLIRAAESLPLSNPATLNPMDVLRWPGVIDRESPDIESLGKSLLTSLDNSLQVLLETRQREGGKLQTMLLDRCEAATQQVDQIREKLPEITQKIRERYNRKAKELQVELDNERLEQEMLILTQKMDVSEELDRLETHIEEVRRVLNETVPVGRRLDFLMQELNREANTLGSKAASVDMSNVSVELKVLIEQMREQIQNIE
jgi:uncharacterized protein (TIGR00255 family)